MNSVYSQSYKKRGFIIYDNEKKNDLSYIKKIISCKKKLTIIINKKILGRLSLETKELIEAIKILHLSIVIDIWVKDDFNRKIKFYEIK